VTVGLWAHVDQVDDVVLQALLTVRARQQQIQKTDRREAAYAEASTRIAARCAAAVYVARGDPAPDGLQELLNGDSDEQAAADRTAYVAAWDSAGKSGSYWLGEFEREAREWVPVSEALTEIIGTMPDWARDLVCDELAQLATGQQRMELFCWGKLPRETFPSGPTRRALYMARRFVGAYPYMVHDYDGPLTLPDPVCQILLEHPRDSEEFWPYDCGACGYEVPHGWLELDAQFRLLNITPCPVCDGDVGYYAWFNTKRARQQGGAR
jgi:hypothetical protein